MKKLTKLRTKLNLQENRLRENFEMFDQIRADAINDIESLTEDFQHMTLVAESIRRNYRALLAQNQLLKDTLLSVVDECECWPKNQCDRCQQILKIIASDYSEQKPDAVRKYGAILSKLRNLG